MSFAVELFDFLMTADFTDAVTYERLTETVDVTSLSDMVLTHLYAGNWDFAYNNIKIVLHVRTHGKHSSMPAVFVRHFA